MSTKDKVNWRMSNNELQDCIINTKAMLKSLGSSDDEATKAQLKRHLTKLLKAQIDRVELIEINL